MAERPMSTAVVFLFGRATEGKLKARSKLPLLPATREAQMMLLHKAATRLRRSER
jgi:hypothetical protein